jgi:hypothetical protein
MKTLVRIAIAVALLPVAASAEQTPIAQQKPNFSGRWAAVSPAKAAGQEQIVKHDDKTLSTEHVSSGGGHRMVYQLDGVERRVAISASNSDITMMATAVWDGETVVISTNTSYPNGMKTRSKETWSLDAKGQLVIDFTESARNVQGPAMKIIYVKKP